MNSLADLPSELKCHQVLHKILWGTVKLLLAKQIV